MSSCPTTQICTLSIWWLLPHQGGWGYFYKQAYYLWQCCLPNHTGVKYLHSCHQFLKSSPPTTYTKIRPSYPLYVTMDRGLLQIPLWKFTPSQNFRDAQKCKASHWGNICVKKINFVYLDLISFTPFLMTNISPWLLLCYVLDYLLLMKFFGWRRRFKTDHVAPIPMWSFFGIAEKPQMMHSCKAQTVQLTRKIFTSTVKLFQTDFLMDTQWTFYNRNIISILTNIHKSRIGNEPKSVMFIS